MTHKGLLALALAAGLTAAAAVEPVPATTPADQEAERLFLEISRRDFAAAKALLAAHPDINLKYSHHPNGDFSIMEKAASSGDPELMRLLLARGGDPRHPNNAPLIGAAFANRHEIIRMLVAAGADVNGDWLRAPRGTAPIFSATTPETLELLLSLGADIEHRDLRTGETPLHSSIDHADVTAALLRHGAKVDSLDYDGHTPLFEAVFWFDPGHLADPKNSWHQESLNALRAIDILIAHGADVNRQDYKGNTALHYAATRYHPPLFAKLLAAGAQIDVPNHWGQTPLMWAAEEPGGAQAVARLLELGADPERRTQDGETPLIAAVDAGNPEAVRLLLRHGAAVDARDQWGRTPLLRIARESGRDGYPRGDSQDKFDARRAAVAAVLLDGGADVNAQDLDGETALTLARAHGHAAVAELLERRGAREPARDASGAFAVTPGLAARRAAALAALPDDCGERNARLAEAAFADCRWMLAALLQAGADVNGCNGNGFTPLMCAAYGARPDTVRWLLDAGADVTARGGDSSVLGQIVRYGRHDLLQLVLPRCPLAAVTQYRDYQGYSLLSGAIYSRDLRVLRALLPLFKQAGMVDAQGGWGTPLIRISDSKEYEDAALLLLEAGADPFRVDLNGENALKLAERHGLNRLAAAIRAKYPDKTAGRE